MRALSSVPHRVVVNDDARYVTIDRYASSSNAAARGSSVGYAKATFPNQPKHANSLAIAGSKRVKPRRKPKAPARELATIVAEIHKTFRSDTASVVKRGELLIEAKQQVKHGEWLQWLDTHFHMDARTAQRAMAAAKFAAKYDTAVVFNLNVDALYALSGGDFSTKVVAAVMAKAATQLIRTRTIYDIEESLEPPPQSLEELNAEHGAEAQLQAQEQQEAEKILDGPPPKLPTAPEEPDHDQYICIQLAAAITVLKRLATKKRERFARSAVPPHDLDTVINFLTALKPIVGEKPTAEAA